MPLSLVGCESCPSRVLAGAAVGAGLGQVIREAEHVTQEFAEVIEGALTGDSSHNENHRTEYILSGVLLGAAVGYLSCRAPNSSNSMSVHLSPSNDEPSAEHSRREVSPAEFDALRRVQLSQSGQPDFEFAPSTFTHQRWLNEDDDRGP